MSRRPRSVRATTWVLAACALATAATARAQGTSAPPMSGAPAPEPAPPAPAKKPPAPWPLFPMAAPPAGATAALAGDDAILQMELSPRGNALVAVVRRGRDTPARLQLWDFASPLAPLRAPELEARAIESIAFSAFDGTLFVASAGGANDWRVDRFALDARKRTLRKAGSVYASPRRITDLVTGLVEYDGQERVFFALEHARGRSQILGVRADGTSAYELTSPTGAATALTAPELRARKPDPDEELQPPRVEKADSARPLSLGPEGTLIWRAGDGTLRQFAYLENWQAPVAVPGGTADVDELVLPNGYFRARWTKGKPGLELVNRAHARSERVSAGVTFASRPALATNGRAFVAERRDGDRHVLETFAMPSRAPAIRVHREVWPAREREQRLERDGILLSSTDADQLYQIYDRLAYQELGCGESGGMYESVFASIDGFLEVLNAGFEAVFVVAEQKVSRPALAAVLKELGRVGKAQGRKRLADVADAATKVLAGNLKHPEGALIQAGARAPSALPINLTGAPVDYADFAPRGPYVATKTLSSYFRAFKLVNLLELAPDERAALAADAGFMAALRSWVDVQRPFLAGTRRPTLFDVGAKVSDVPAACLPARLRAAPPLLYPLAWSMDSEILESSVERQGVGSECGSVPGRGLPTGLDLLAGLGSPEARTLQAPEYKTFPALAASRVTAERRAAVLARASTFVDSYLRLVQMLSTETQPPEAVSPDLWQRRLLQAALGAWVGLRHTLVLVSERGAAECDAERRLFELLQAEPARGAVDPLPAVWRQVGALLEQLAEHAKSQRVAAGLAAQLREQAGVARRFGGLAEKQMRQEALTAADYALIERYGGAVEHPFLLFKSVLKKSGEGEIPEPEPVAKIVDIQAGANGEIWHAALGRPLEATVLLGDRGVLVSATGAVYSYYEATAAAPLDDKAWRARLDTAKPPAWVEPLLAPPRASRSSGETRSQ